MTITDIEMPGGNGDAMVFLPKETIEELRWNEYTVLSVVEVDGELQVRKKTDWTTDQLQEGNNLERVLDDIEHNGTVHHVMQGGKQVVIVPHSNELEGLLEKAKKI